MRDQKPDAQSTALLAYFIVEGRMLLRMPIYLSAITMSRSSIILIAIMARVLLVQHRGNTILAIVRSITLKKSSDLHKGWFFLNFGAAPARKDAVSVNLGKAGRMIETIE